MKTLEERWRKSVVIPEAADACWAWSGRKIWNGYGLLAGRGTVLAHRASWRLHRGPIPDGLCVLHRCDVRECTNPDHLFLGTNRDNVHDAMAKGRRAPMPDVRGERHGMAKLTTADVVQIRTLRLPKKVLVERFGISRRTVNQILQRHTWRHVA